MNDAITLELGDVEIGAVEVMADDDQISLESLVGGHAMAELAASCEACSCCVACCCCC